MVKKGLLITLACFMCFALSGCAALSALKSLAGSGDSDDRSVNVDANVAARDNKHAVFSSESTRSYANKGDVINNGIEGKGAWKKILASAVQGLDVLLTVIAILVFKGFSKYLDVRADIFERRLKLKMAELKLKELKSKK